MLFIDDKDIVSMRGVERVVHPAKKYEGNPVVSGDQPWEDDVIMGGTVRKENGAYRIWYQSFGRRPYNFLHLYADSGDGLPGGQMDSRGPAQRPSSRLLGPALWLPRTSIAIPHRLLA